MYERLAASTTLREHAVAFTSPALFEQAKLAREAEKLCKPDHDDFEIPLDQPRVPLRRRRVDAAGRLLSSREFHQLSPQTVTHDEFFVGMDRVSKALAKRVAKAFDHRTSDTPFVNPDGSILTPPSGQWQP